MAKKLDRLTLPPQCRIDTEVKRQVLLTADADRRALSDHIGFLLELGLKLRKAMLSKELIVRICQDSSLEVVP
jgi:hypothetical protein